MKKKQKNKIINKLVEESFRDGKFSEAQILRSIKILRSQPKSDAILALSQYLKALKRKQREHTMYVETVVPISPVQLKKIKRIIEKKVKIAQVVTNINPEILGGFKLRVGDEIWDETVLGRMNQIQEVITHGRSN